jgi:hypothetical protein
MTLPNLIIALAQADVVGWACFAVGIFVLVAGVAIGLSTSRTQARRKAREAKDRLADASAKIEEAKGHIDRASSAVSESTRESFAVGATGATEAAEAAGESTEAARTAVEQMEGIVASLPENLRFAGLLVLVGTVLMGVATIQFGGVSLF